MNRPHTHDESGRPAFWHLAQQFRDEMDSFRRKSEAGNMPRIVAERDLEALEAMCQRLGTYSAVKKKAECHNIDPDELEELLWKIS